MDYTKSPDFATTTAGRRLHQLAGGLTTVVSDKDLNGPACEIMEVIREGVSLGGISGPIEFDSENPASYTQLLTSIKKILAVELNNASVEQATASEIQAGSTDKVLVVNQLKQALEQGLSAATFRLGNLVDGLYSFNQYNTSVEMTYSTGAVFRLIQFFKATSTEKSQFVIGASSDALEAPVSIGGKDKFARTPTISGEFKAFANAAGSVIDAHGCALVPPGAGFVLGIPGMNNCEVVLVSINNTAGTVAGAYAASAHVVAVDAIGITHTAPTAQLVNWIAKGRTHA